MNSNDIEARLKVTQAEHMSAAMSAARLCCDDFGYTPLAIVSDVSDDLAVEGFTFIRPGQDSTAPSWVSFRKAYYNKWDGSDGN